MIIPARWYSEGKGLDEFRNEMLTDKHIAELHDFPETSDCFPGLNIRGGICYFLWSKDHSGDCKIVSHKNGSILSSSIRPLLEPKTEIFVRYNEAIEILRKIQVFKEKTFDQVVSSRKPFGIDSNFADFSNKKSQECDIRLYRFGDDGYISDDQVLKNKEWVSKIKVLVSKASPGGDSYPHQIISRSILAEPKSCSTETYLVVSTYNDTKQAENVIKYVQTKFYRAISSDRRN